MFLTGSNGWHWDFFLQKSEYTTHACFAKLRKNIILLNKYKQHKLMVEYVTLIKGVVKSVPTKLGWINRPQLADSTITRVGIGGK